MNLRFLALPAALAAVLALSGCANDNARYRADVYGPGSLNQAQAVKTVEILSVQTGPASRSRMKPRTLRHSLPVPSPVPRPA